MIIELKPEDERSIERAIHLGAYHDSNEVLSAALEMLAEDLDDVAVSSARQQEPRFTLDQVEADMGSVGN